LKSTNDAGWHNARFQGITLKKLRSEVEGDDTDDGKSHDKDTKEGDGKADDK